MSAMEVDEPGPSQNQEKILGPSEKIVDAIRELQADIDFLPPYREEVVLACAKQIKAFFELNSVVIRELTEKQQLNQTVDPDDHQVQELRVRQQLMNRMKRCCIAYLNERIMRLKTFKWRYGGSLPTEVQTNMSAEEKVWMREYQGNLFKFQQIIGGNEDEETDGVNLIDAMNPPKTNLVTIRVVQEYGPFETYDGIVVILKNKTIHSIPRVDTEQLLRKGIIKLM